MRNFPLERKTSQISELDFIDYNLTVLYFSVLMTVISVEISTLDRDITDAEPENCSIGKLIACTKRCKIYDRSRRLSCIITHSATTEILCWIYLPFTASSIIAIA